MIQKEINEMIHLLEHHFEANWGSPNILTVGGIAGSNIFKHAIHACMTKYSFDTILVLDGCQDYIGLLRKPIHNYKYYMSVFQSCEIPTIDEMLHPFHRSLLVPKPGYQIIVNESMLSRYHALIIQNAHLIPRMYLDALCKYFHGKILLIVDPLDIGGEMYTNVPTLTDALTKQSPMIALARSMYHIDTRSVDRRIKGDLKSIKMRKTSIGKMDANQYITNDEMILNMIQEKQLHAQYRRNQRVMVSQEHIEYFVDQNQNTLPIGPKTMLSIMTVSKPLMKLRIHSSTSVVHANLSYMNNRTGIYVRPANIIHLRDAIFHRFQNVVLVLGEEPMTNREWYSLMKIANTISITKY